MTRYPIVYYVRPVMAYQVRQRIEGKTTNDYLIVTSQSREAAEEKCGRYNRQAVSGGHPVASIPTPPEATGEQP